VKAVLSILGVLVLIALVVIIGGCSTYNGLVSLKQRVDQSWADVENVYQRRADLIPNLVKTVEGAADFEKTTLTEVIEARQHVTNVQMSAGAPDAVELERFEAGQAALSGALSRLLVTVERYPELKANTNFQMLQTQLEGTENRIAVERRKFNETATEYNIAIKKFPTVIFAGMLGFTPRALFSAKPGADVAPEVNFNFGDPAPAATP
jgi:Uncharacterized conserved protein